MIIFVEGPDGSGKTTLVKRLTEEFGYDLVVGPQRQDNKSKESADWLGFITSIDNEVVICDRSFLTEVVYRLYDHDTNTYMRFTLLSYLLEKQCKFVFCTSPTAFTDAEERGEDTIVTFEQHKQIERLYGIITDMLMLFAPDIQTTFYNWKKQDIMDVVRFINSSPKSQDTI